jgi:RNA polymerase sigma-70 factor (ECF subfamily)
MARRREVHLDVQDSGPMGANPMDGVALAASGQMPTRRLDKTEMQDVVRSAISTLNERQKMAVLLSKFEEMSYADIAETMNMSPQAVKSLLSRARENLRAILEPYLERGERPAPQP